MAKSEVRSKRARKPRFRVGMIVNVRSFADPKHKGIRYTKHGWRYGFEYGRIIEVIQCPPKSKIPFAYFMDGWISAISEDELRPLTKREKGEGGRRGK